VKIHPTLNRLLISLAVDEMQGRSDSLYKWKNAGSPLVEEEGSNFTVSSNSQAWANGTLRMSGPHACDKDARIKELEAQLPAGMAHCTIRFRECEKGHGWLTADNWVQHRCPTCTIKELEAKLANSYDATSKAKELIRLFSEGVNDIRNAALEEAAKEAEKDTPREWCNCLVEVPARIRALKKETK